MPCIYDIIPSPDATEGGYIFSCYGVNQFPIGGSADPSLAAVREAFASWNQFDVEELPGPIWRITSKDAYERAPEAAEELVSDPNNPLRKPI